MEGHLMMSAKERKRLLVFDRLRERQMSLRDAAGRLDISHKQSRRSYRRYREEGARGLVHRSRGRRSNRAKPEEFRLEAVKRYEGLVVDHETLRRWLLAENKWQKRRRRRKHRAWRERKAHFGEMVQLNGQIQALHKDRKLKFESIASSRRSMIEGTEHN